MIIDFLNTNPIKYALTVNLTVYTSCIEQFWATAKNINGEAQIHAKVDGKKVIIFEATIRRDLKFEDERGIDCLSSVVIFEQLTLMGSTMASAIIYLATNQKLNFSMYIFESMVKHLDTGNKFLMYPRFGKVFLDKQVDGMLKHNAIYVIPSHTKKVFGNIKREGKDFSRKETPLFPTMFVPAQEEELAQEISSLKKRVKRLEKKRRSRTHGLKRLYKVGLSARVESSAEEQSLGEEDASKQGRNIADINADAKITLVNETSEDQGRFDDQEMIDTRALEALKTSKLKIKGIIVRDHKEPSESTTIPTLIADSTRPKARGIVMEEPSEATTTTIPIPSKVQDKGEGIMAKIEDDFELGQRLQAEEQEQLTDGEKAKLFMEFLEKRRKFFVAKRAEEKRNTPPTKAQQRSLMCTYLKNMDRWKPKALKTKSFAEIQKLSDQAFKRVNIFVDMDTEVVRSSKKAEAT
uniref:Uncharacterized protein n=1 Tax=Tanacetum cinerariifolium TaxID=118510 RepID=A0A6L2LEV7_TANCI|nr:hypothetical protein [Tanacetum cinerariifolium]